MYNKYLSNISKKFGLIDSKNYLRIIKTYYNDFLLNKNNYDTINNVFYQMINKQKYYLNYLENHDLHNNLYPLFRGMPNKEQPIISLFSKLNTKNFIYINLL